MAAARATRFLLGAHAAFIVVGEALILATDIPQRHITALTALYVLLNTTSLLIMFGYALRMQGRERASWLLLGGAMLCWNLGSIYLNSVLVPAGEVPVPSVADAALLSVVPLAIAGLMLRMPPALMRRSTAQRIDGVAAALAAAALSAAIALETVVANAPGRTVEVLVISAYPIGDTLLIGLLVASLALNGWRADRPSALVACGLVCFWASDLGFVLLQAQNAYAPPSAIDVGWSLCILLLALGARSAALGKRAGLAAPPRYADIALPIGFAAIGLATLATAAIVSVHPAAVVLAAASLALMLLRLGLSLAENSRMLRASQHEAMTDALTRLGNRRALLRDLGESMADGAPATLVLFDLDGFKSYNDVFGHPAGDALLERLAHSLAARIPPCTGAAYRIGGDEFCALIGGHADAAELGALVDALSESGEGFQIGASFGAAHLPPEAGTAEDALRIVDQRMYERKNSNRSSARAQSTEVLVQVLCERVPQMQRHLDAVREHATSTAVEAGIEPVQIERLRAASMLHDIGCMSIPDAILTKPGRLTDEEAAFVRQHPAAGARILEAAPALRHLAPIVRAIHERFDGSGYPDGLAGESIPVESRIIAICDAYDTMTQHRPFRSPLTESEAFDELHAKAGTQFDPVLVRAFENALGSTERHERAA